jgi:hypothetical protein
MITVNKELQIRYKEKENAKDVYEILGVEIKRRRILLSQTLEAVSQNICSVSYLCKIERSKIDPGKHIIKEICNRLEIEDNKVVYLYDLKDTLNKCISSFLHKKYEYIKIAYENGKGFENYRFKIISFIYFISIKDMDSALIEYNSLVKLVSNMLDFDLLVFTLMTSIFLYYSMNFKGALESISTVGKFHLTSDMKILYLISKFRIHAAMSLPSTAFHYEMLKEELVRTGAFDLIEYENYIYAYYLVKNKAYDEAKEIVANSKIQYAKNSIGFLSDFFSKKVGACLDYGDRNLNDFCKFIKASITLKEDYKNKLLLKDRSYYEPDFEYLLVEYLFVNGNKARFNYIFSTAIPELTLNDNKFLKDFFYDELSLIPYPGSKLRTLYTAYQAIYHGVSLSKYKFLDDEDCDDEEAIKD